MLYKISLKNVKKSIKDYAIYFFTLILGVSIFYVFNALESQTVLMNVSSSTTELIDLLMTMLSGILSLFMGLILGVILSQAMSLLVANMFEANLTKFTFIFSKSACLKTIIYFTVMYLIVMIFNTISISKCKLIDLLNSSKKIEKIKLKNPIICSIIFIIAVVLLSYAYYLVTVGFKNLNEVTNIIKPIIIGVISTFLIFYSLSGLIIKLTMSMKKFYYKKLNSFIIRQFISKINTTVISTTI